MLFLDSAPCRQSRGAPLDGAAVDADGIDPIEVEGNPRVPLDVVQQSMKVLDRHAPILTGMDALYCAPMMSKLSKALLFCSVLAVVGCSKEAPVTAPSGG